MSKEKTKKIAIILELFLLGGSLFFIIWNNINTITALGIITIVILIPLFLIRPYYSLLLLIIVRNTTDTYAESTFINFFDVIHLNFSSILGILIILWAIYIFLKEKMNIQKIPLTIPWFLFLIFGLISVSYSVTKVDTLKMLLKLVDFYFIYALAYFYFQKYKSEKKLFFLSVIVAYLIPIILGVFQILTKTGFRGPEQFNRIQSTYSHPNIFSFNLLLLFIILISCKIEIKNKKIEKILSVFLILIPILILYTLTRSAWIGLSILFISLILIYKRKYILKYLLLISFLVFLFIMALNYTSLKYFDWTNITFIARAITSNTFISSWEWRLNTWSEMSAYIYQSPVIGFGLDTYRFLREKQVYSIYEDLYYAHNDYLKFLIELGFIGLLLYLNIIFQTLKKIWTKFKSNQNKKYLLGFIGIGVIYLIAGVDNILMSTSLQWVLWVFIAYLLTED
jgi:putative inorganic carbon (hco3(-)) transporter